MFILGILLILLGSVSIVCNRQGAKSYVEFQKGWGLQGSTAFIIGRLLGIVGALVMVGVGLFAILR